MSERAADFDPLTMPLTGVHSVEASAGTGKTHAIGTLYLRYLLEQGVRVDQMLVTSFTEAAAAELKQRLRGRLRAALELVRGCASESEAREAAKDEQLPRLLAEAGAWGEAGERVANRLDDALLAFDEAPVLTIHGFCNRTLSELVFETGSSFDAELLPSVQPLIDDAVADFAARHWTAGEGEAATWVPLDDKRWRTMREIATQAVEAPDAVPEPEPAGLEDLTRPEALERFERAVGELGELWATERQAIRDQLHRAANQGILGQGTHKPKQIDDAIGFVDTLVAQQSWTLFKRDQNRRLEAKQRRLAQEEINAGTKKAYKGHAPQHVAFQRIQDAVDAVSDLETHQASFEASLMAQLARDVRSHVSERKRRLNQMSFADLLHGVADALQAPETRALLCDALRRRYHVALVDEFQDTDPVQYRIFHELFQRGLERDQEDGRAFVMIGDPKQSIYRFRGADVHSYLDAVAATPAEQRHTMAINWRSDDSLVAGVLALFGTSSDPFRDERIELPRVTARHPDRFEAGPAVDLAFVRRDPREEPNKRPAKDRALRHVVRVAAGELVAQLNAAPALSDGDGERRLSPGDVAILCRAGKHLRMLQRELAERGVPAVLHTDESIFATPEAEAVRDVLCALLRPGDPTAVLTALASSVFGLEAAELDALREDERRLADWSGRFHGWHDAWRERGFIFAWRRLLDEQEVVPRIAERLTGERQVTNVLHLGELLHRHEVEAHAGPEQVLRHLKRKMAESDREIDDEAQLRLETDASAVQLCTIHRSKGLEYPVVYCPTLWDVIGKRDPAFVLSRRDDDGNPMDTPVLDTGSERFDEWAAREERDREAESRRLLYVAMTRARHQCRIFWTAAQKAELSPLSELLFGDAGPAADDDSIAGQLRARVAELGTDAVGVRVLGPRSSRSRYEPPEHTGRELSAPSRQRGALSPLKGGSFTALAASREPDEASFLDRDEGGPAATSSEEPEAPAPEAGEAETVLAGMPGGRPVGDLFHAVAEELLRDRALVAADRGQVRDAAGDSIERHGKRVRIGEPWHPVLADRVADCLAAPLGAGPAECRLVEPSAEDRVPEMPFVLAAGTRDRGVGSAAAAAAFEQAEVEAVRDYAPRVRSMAWHRLRGFLGGFIDLVFRWDGRWYLLDYKTNRLGERARDYEGERLTEAMAEHDYLLQYHLYAAALDRFLRQRVPDYTYDAAFGGVVYLFVRGFDGNGRGVYFDRPSRAAIETLQAAFEDGGRS